VASFQSLYLGTCDALLPVLYNVQYMNFWEGTSEEAARAGWDDDDGVGGAAELVAEALHD
jgi:hypothetical protein